MLLLYYNNIHNYNNNNKKENVLLLSFIYYNLQIYNDILTIRVYIVLRISLEVSAFKKHEVWKKYVMLLTYGSKLFSTEMTGHVWI